MLPNNYNAASFLLQCGIFMSLWFVVYFLKEISDTLKKKEQDRKKEKEQSIIDSELKKRYYGR